MGDDLYRLIPEEGKHLAESRDTEGAYRGVYLDDETNKPSGAGEFVKVDPDELFDNDGDEVPDNDSSSDAAGIAALIALGIGIGVAVTKAYPHVKKWATEKAVPSVKRLWNKMRGKEESVSLRISEEDFVDEGNDSTALSVDVAFNEYRENMSSEDAQRELIEAFILYLESMKKVHRVANANVVDSEGRITDGKMLIEDMANKGMLESINEILRRNPALLTQKQAILLSSILGYEVTSQKEYIPITVEALSEGLFAG